MDLTGGNRFIFELSNGLVEKGYKVTITHLGKKENYSWFPEVEAEVINVEYRPANLVSKCLCRFSSGLKKSHLSTQDKCFIDAMPDCDINVATFCLTAIPTYYSQKGRGYYIVQHYEPWFFDDAKTKERATLSYSLPLKKLCVSKWLTEKVQGSFIGNGINLSRFRQTKKPKLYDVMVVSRQISWKGNYSPVIKALKRKGFRVFVADGRLSEDELVTTYNASRLFLFLSEHEGFGYPPLEAMACGVPVITSPCLEYATHFGNAFVLKHDFAVSDILDAVDLLLKDDKLYDQLSATGLLTAQEYDFSRVVNRFCSEMI